MATPKRDPFDTGGSHIPWGDDLSRHGIENGAAKHNILRRTVQAQQKHKPLTSDTQLDETLRALVDESRGFIAAVTRRAGSEITDRALAFNERDRTLRDLRHFEEENGLASPSAIYNRDVQMFGAALITLIRQAKGGFHGKRKT